MRKILILALFSFILAGCGSGGGGGGVEGGVGPFPVIEREGSVRINFAQGTIPTSTQIVELNGFNNAGTLVYGPNRFPLISTQSVLEVGGVPVTTVNLTGRLIGPNSATVGQFNIPITIAAGETVSVAVTVTP